MLFEERTVTVRPKTDTGRRRTDIDRSTLRINPAPSTTSTKTAPNANEFSVEAGMSADSTTVTQTPVTCHRVAPHLRCCTPVTRMPRRGSIRWIPLLLCLATSLQWTPSLTEPGLIDRSPPRVIRVVTLSRLLVVRCVCRFRLFRPPVTCTSKSVTFPRYASSFAWHAIRSRNTGPVSSPPGTCSTCNSRKRPLTKIIPVRTRPLRPRQLLQPRRLLRRRLRLKEEVVVVLINATENCIGTSRRMYRRINRR